MRLRTVRVFPAALTLATVTALCAPATAAHGAASGFGPLPPQNPATAANGTATMHGDSASSDTTSYPGPGSGTVHWSRTALASACPTVVIGSDRLPVALCTTIFGQTPTVHLLDPGTGADLASLALPKGSLFGGVYAYLDNTDALVVVDGDDNLLRIGHHLTAGAWTLTVDQSTPLAASSPPATTSSGSAPVGTAGSGSPPQAGSSAPPTPPPAPYGRSTPVRAWRTASPPSPATPPSPPITRSTC
ncbi:hypothetical protein ACFQZC_36460 [Streptacidiphilus monticola]